MISALLLVTLAFAGPPHGFRGIVLGSECSTIPNLKHAVTDYRGTDAELCTYVRVGEDLTLGPVPLRSVFYSCWSGRLVAVHIRLEAENGLRLLPGLVETWGEPGRPSPLVFAWLDDSAFASLVLEPRDPYLRLADVVLNALASEAIARQDAAMIEEGL